MGELLGAGNEGVVFRATMADWSVVVKFMRTDRTSVRQKRTDALIKQDLSRSVDVRIAAPFDAVVRSGLVGHVSAFAPGINVSDLEHNPALLNLRQRVMTTIELGLLLAKLHSHGLAFGDLNKGAVRVQIVDSETVQVHLVDLDSVVMRGVPLPLTLGTPDTAAPELRNGEQPKSVALWQAADWTAFGHIALELLLAKTASCGIDSPELQVDAYMGIPPCLRSDDYGARVDRGAGLPSESLPPDLKRLLARLFDPNPTVRDGKRFLMALATELLNNHQLLCGTCGAAYFAHAARHLCFACGKQLAATLKVVLPTGEVKRVEQSLQLTCEQLGGHPALGRLPARIFTLGSATYLSTLNPSCPVYLYRNGARMLLPVGIHIPMLPNDRVQFGDKSATAMLFRAVI